MTNQPHFKYVLLVLDTLIISAAFLVSYALNATGSLKPLFYVVVFVGLMLAYLFSFRANDLYKRHVVINRYRHFILVIKALIVAAIMVVVALAAVNFQYLRVEGKDLLRDFFLISLVLFVVVRVAPIKALLRFLASQNIYQSRLLIIGGDEAAKYVADSLASDKLGSFTVVGFVDDYRALGAPIHREHVNLGSLEDLAAVVRKFDVAELLVAIDNAPYERLIHIVDTCLKTGKVVRIYSNLLDVIAKKMSVEFYATIPVIMLSQQSERRSYRLVKPLIDVVLAAFGLLLLAPVLVLIAVGIKVSSRGPILFTQKRIGKDGVPFKFMKFRSMHVGTDSDKHKEFVTNFISSSGRSEQDKIKVFKITNDPRIFGFGKFIRKTSFDEFPQLYNVLRGEMSLVGPRPCLQYEWECYDEWHKSRLRILPGCTGLWQALGRSTVTFEEMVILDLYYISNMSLWLDLRIVLQTFPVIFLGKGAF
jgi:exopolysaccharide biosynthesis polyprenyl glycosylphosphotransferase